LIALICAIIKEVFDNFALKIMDLTRIERMFPKTDAPSFLEHASREWHNLMKGITEGRCTIVSRLRDSLKPKRGRLKEYTVFVVWLILCLERPWERPAFMKLTLNHWIEDGQNKAWQFNLTEEHGENIWNRIDAILARFLDDYPTSFQLRTLRNQLKKSKLKSVVISQLIDPNIFYGFGAPFKKFGKSIRSLAEAMSPLFKSDLIQAARLFEYLKEQKHISKRDLMRKFGINKARCDYLLNYILSEDESYLKILDGFPNHSVWIVYTGP
jgi:hypothetical protein